MKGNPESWSLVCNRQPRNNGVEKRTYRNGLEMADAKDQATSRRYLILRLNVSIQVVPSYHSGLSKFLLVYQSRRPITHRVHVKRKP